MRATKTANKSQTSGSKIEVPNRGQGHVARGCRSRWESRLPCYVSQGGEAMEEQQPMCCWNLCQNQSIDKGA